jgi:hypothetical protein
MAFTFRTALFLASALGGISTLPLGCAPGRPLTPYSASEKAALLANDRCQKTYGLRPFASQDFEAEFIDGRWVWGGEGSRHVDGFSVEVSFAPDGGRKRVEVHRDEAFGNPEGL